MSQLQTVAPDIVDYSYAKPAPGTIKTAGFRGAQRYLGHDVRCLTVNERKALQEQGLGVGLVYETYANRALSGYEGGKLDAQIANALADEQGFPDWIPIAITTVDFGPFGLQISGPIADHARGAASVSKRPPGGYGCYDVIEHWGHNDLCKALRWQCCAWSGGGEGSGGSMPDPNGFRRRLSQYAHMYQRLGYVLGNSSDANAVFQDPIWLWDLDETAPQPTPTPVPPALLPVPPLEDPMDNVIIMRPSTYAHAWAVYGGFQRVWLQGTPDLASDLYIEGSVNRILDPHVVHPDLPEQSLQPIVGTPYTLWICDDDALDRYQPKPGTEVPPGTRGSGSAETNDLVVGDWR